MSPKYFLQFAGLSLLAFASCEAQLGDVPCAPIKVRNCPGVEPKAELTSVYIQDCFEEPCVFKKGRNVTMEMDVKFKEPVEILEAELHALIGAIPIKWDGVNPNACDDIVSEKGCPFEPTDFSTYGVKLAISPAYPTVTADVRYVLLDRATRNVQVCWIVRASVEN